MRAHIVECKFFPFSAETGAGGRRKWLGVAKNCENCEDIRRNGKGVRLWGEWVKRCVRFEMCG